MLSSMHITCLGHSHAIMIDYKFLLNLNPEDYSLLSIYALRPGCAPGISLFKTWETRCEQERGKRIKNRALRKKCCQSLGKNKA